MSSPFSSGVILTEDERDCCQRALSLRRDALRSELIFINENPIVNLQHAEACRILKREIELIARCIRALWIGTGRSNGNYEDVP